MSEYKDYKWTEERGIGSYNYLYTDLKTLLCRDQHTYILDVGCGNGLIANSLIKEGFDVYGTDGAISGIEIANKKNPKRFYVQDLTSHDLPPELQHIKFNTIISTEVIEHLYNPRGYIEFCKNILINNGGEIL